MASSFIDKSTLATVIGTQFDNVTVRPLRPKYIFDEIAMEKEWNLNTNPNKGDVLQFPVQSALSANTAALDPTAATITGSQKLTYTRKNVSLELYGDHSTLDIFESHNETFIDDVADASWQLADQAMNSLNKLARATMDLQKYANQVSGTLSSTYHLYGSYNSNNTIGPLTAKTVRFVASKLRGANVQPYPDGLYRWIIHPIQYTQLRADSDNAGWTETSKYVDNAELRTGDIGVFEGVRFMVNTEVNGASTNTVSSYAFGRDFIGKGIGFDVQVKTADRLQGNHENLLGIHWEALIGYGRVRRESGYIIETTNTRK